MKNAIGVPKTASTPTRIRHVRQGRNQGRFGNSFDSVLTVWDICSDWGDRLFPKGIKEYRRVRHVIVWGVYEVVRSFPHDRFA